MFENNMISVIIPVYNAEEYIEECLHSLKNQTYNNFEAILVDDGSTDKSIDIIKKHTEKDNRFRLFSQKNAGPSAARNQALKHAKGDFIMKLDADDFVSNNYMSEAIRRISETGADAAISNVCNYYGPSDQRHNKNYIEYECISGIEGLIKSINWNGIHSYLIVKKDLYIGFIYDTSGTFGDEVSERILISKCRKLVYTSGIYYYRQNPTSITKKISVKYFDLCKSYIQTKQLLIDNKIYDQTKYNIEKRLLNILTSTRYYYLAHKHILSASDRKYAKKCLYDLFNNIDKNSLNDEYRNKGLLNLVLYKIKTASMFNYNLISSLLYIKMKKFYG